MACDPAHPEPDLALFLEICDVINQTKKNTPREAAMAIVEHVNSRDTHEAMLALSVWLSSRIIIIHSCWISVSRIAGIHFISNWPTKIS